MKGGGHDRQRVNRRVVSMQMQFVEIDSRGNTRAAGCRPAGND
jgi:hypothetical protein